MRAILAQKSFKLHRIIGRSVANARESEGIDFVLGRSALRRVFDRPRSHFVVNSTRRRKTSEAAPESIAAAPILTASRGSWLRPAAISAAAVFAKTMSRAGPRSAASSRRILSALSAGDCTERSVARHSSSPSCPADHSETSTAPSSTRKTLVWPQRLTSSSSSLPQTTSVRLVPRRAAAAASFSASAFRPAPEELELGRRRIGQRSEQIENRAIAQLSTDGGGVLHRAVHERRKTEADADLVDAACDAFGSQVDADPQSLEHVGGSAAARKAAVGVFRHGNAAGRRHQGRGRADIEGLQLVPAGAAGIEQPGAARLNGRHSLSHGAGRADDFVDGLPLELECGQQHAQSDGRGIAIHHLQHGRVHLIFSEAALSQQNCDRIVDGVGHAEFLAAIRDFARSNKKQLSTPTFPFPS